MKGKLLLLYTIPRIQENAPHEIRKRSLFPGAVTVVTGGGRGIGHAIATRLAGMDANVIITGRDEAHAQQVARDLTAQGQRCDGFGCDVTDLASVDALGERLRRDYGQRGHPGKQRRNRRSFRACCTSSPPADWDAILNTNLRGVFYMLRAIVPLMIANRGGHIINISSLAGKNPLPRGAAYSASKWGLNGMTYGVAEELRWREHPRQRHLSRLGQHRLQSATPGQGDRQDAPARTTWPTPSPCW